MKGGESKRRGSGVCVCVCVLLLGWTSKRVTCGVSCSKTITAIDDNTAQNSLECLIRREKYAA